MADNVFGNPITNDTLEGMPKYEGKTITRLDRAQVAHNMKNANDKDRMAREYGEKLKSKWGDGVATICLIYNATGDTIKFICDHNWHGHIGPSPYPKEIANGQWGCFLHVKTQVVPLGSAAAVVYRGLNSWNQSCDWMAAWSNPWNRIGYDNTAYTEIREDGHYTKNDHWDYIFGLFENGNLSASDTWGGCKSDVTIGNDTTAIFGAIFTLDGA